MNKEFPRYLLDKYQMIGTVTISALFAIIFMNLYAPFSETAWFGLGKSTNFLYTLLFFFVAVLILILSRVVMYRTKYLFDMKMWQYVLWCSGEILSICGIYTAITIHIGEIPMDMSSSHIFLKSLLYGTISLAVPYIISALALSLVEKDKYIRLMNYSNVVSDEPVQTPSEQKITLFDIGGTLRFSVKKENLYFIESDDNYIKVWYEDGKGEVTQYVLRCRMKTVEETFRGSSLVRCHRKYVVNTDHVKVLRRSGEGVVLEIDTDKIPPIPVSKTYEKAVLSHFNPENS